VDDSIRNYTTEEEKQLSVNLLQVTQQIHKGSLRQTPATVELLRELRRQLFQGVRDHSGQIRRVGYGAEYLRFGPNRSVQNVQVPGQLEELFSTIRRSLGTFDKNPDDLNYDSQAIQLAVWAHAQVVRIHPFEDGNGRSSRLLMNWILVRLGLRPIAVEAVKEDYITCLNHYFAKRDLTPLFDLLLRLYPIT
jgi:Fic family protein